MTRPLIGVTSVLLARIRGTQLLLNEVINMPKLNNEQELENWSDDTDHKIDRLSEAVDKASDLQQHLMEDKYKRANELDDDELTAEFGRYLKAVVKGDEATIAKMGGARVRGTKHDRDFKVYPMGGLGKANLGEPLTGDDSDTTVGGQYLLPAYIYQQIVLRTEGGASMIIPAVRNVPMENRLLRYPTAGTEFAFTVVTNEATDKTEQNPTFSYVDLECETYAGFVGVSDELMDDTFINIGQLLRTEAAEALTFDVIEEQILASDSAPSVGLLNNTSCASHVIDGITFDSLTWSDLRAAIASLTSAKQRRNASFVMHPTVWSALTDQQDGAGRYFWDPVVGPPLRAWSYPVLLSDAMPPVSETAVSTPFVLFGNMRNAIHGTRIGMELRYYDSTFYSVQSDENFFRIRTRQAFACGVPADIVRITTAAS